VIAWNRLNHHQRGVAFRRAVGLQYLHIRH
jgi:hypothetical protein